MPFKYKADKLAAAAHKVIGGAMLADGNGGSAHTERAFEEDVAFRMGWGIRG
jgi:hypothetical protein